MRRGRRSERTTLCDRYKWSGAISARLQSVMAPCCCGRKQAGCHGRERNRSRALFSLKREQKGQADKSQKILHSTPFLSKSGFSLTICNIAEVCTFELGSTLPGKCFFYMKINTHWIIEHESSSLTFPELSATSQGLPLQREFTRLCHGDSCHTNWMAREDKDCDLSTIYDHLSNQHLLRITMRWLLKAPKSWWVKLQVFEVKFYITIR